MSEAAIILSIAALCIAGYGLFMLRQFITSVDRLATTLENTMKKLEQLDGTVAEQSKAIAALESKLSKPQPQQNALEFLPQLAKSAGNSSWGPIMALGIKIFTAYWRKRQGSSKSNAENQKALAE